MLALTRQQCIWVQNFGGADTQVAQRKLHNEQVMSYVNERIKFAEEKFTEVTGEVFEVPKTSWAALTKGLATIERRVTAARIAESKLRSRQIAEDAAEGAKERSQAANEAWQREQDRNAIREAVRRGIEDAKQR